MSIYSATWILILVMDPVGNIPVFLSQLRAVDKKRYNWIILRETFIAYIILIIFLFCGSYIMEGLHLTEAALGIAGGIILLLISVRMIFPPDHVTVDKVEGEPFIVPLAVPLTAGPSALAMVLLFASKEPARWPDWLLAITIASMAFLLIMFVARYLLRILGERGLIALERLMGMILTILAVQMFLTGLKAYFQLP